VNVTAADLLDVPEGDITEAGLRQNINVGIRYLEAWLRGMGCVPLYNLMEDAATAEISRTQVWQWLRHGAQLDDGRAIDRALFDALQEAVMTAIREELGEESYAQSRFDMAANLFAEMSTSDNFSEFLTLPAYDMIVSI
jgi:malate synthase